MLVVYHMAVVKSTHGTWQYQKVQSFSWQHLAAKPNSPAAVCTNHTPSHRPCQRARCIRSIHQGPQVIMHCHGQGGAHTIKWNCTQPPAHASMLQPKAIALGAMKTTPVNTACVHRPPDTTHYPSRQACVVRLHRSRDVAAPTPTPTVQVQSLRVHPRQSAGLGPIHTFVRRFTLETTRHGAWVPKSPACPLR